MNDTSERQDTRERLIAAAARLFAERGFDGTSVRDITCAAKANLGSVTYHFGGKGELFAAVMERKTSPLHQILNEVAVSDLDPKEKLRDIMLRTSLHILHTDPSLKAFFMECIQGGDRLPPEALGGLEERNKVVGAIIKQGMAQGLFRSCDVESVTWIFFGMLTPYVLHEPFINTGRHRGRYDESFVRKIAASAADLFFAGLMR